MTEPEKLIYNWYLAEPVESFLENYKKDPKMGSDGSFSNGVIDIHYNKVDINTYKNVTFLFRDENGNRRTYTFHNYYKALNDKTAEIVKKLDINKSIHEIKMLKKGLTNDIN